MSGSSKPTTGAAASKRPKLKSKTKKKTSLNLVNAILLLIAVVSVALMIFSNLQMSKAFYGSDSCSSSPHMQMSSFVGSILGQGQTSRDYSTSSASFLSTAFSRSLASQAAAFEPFDLSVNQLQVIPFWEGAMPSEERAATTEDFLPITSADVIELRFRLRGLPKETEDENHMEAMRGVAAYQVIAEHAHEPNELLWNSGKRTNTNKDFIAPSSIEWDYQDAPLPEGTVVRWKVLVWDAVGDGPSSSDWSKFGVGPKEWTGKWITHPKDYATLFKDGQPRERPSFHDRKTTPEMCSLWEQRRPLALARTQFDIENHNEIVGALLVASGLGMFSISMNGKTLSSSSVQDPPLTDFAQRVSYRGYDVTEEVKKQQSHAIGISLGSGWWDHRPVNGAIVFMDFMPKGSLTTVAQMHVTYRDGSTKVLVPTGGETNSWSMGKGALIESSLYTGEHINLQRQKAIEGWDTTNPPSIAAETIDWVKPEQYKSTDQKKWLDNIEGFAVNRKNTRQKANGPIGHLQPLEMQPVMPIRKLPAVSTKPLGDPSLGRWLVDFGKGMSGIVRFENGVPEPFVPRKYPRAHDMTKTFNANDRFISIVYGDSLEMPTGDINLALVAGFGHHAGGERNVSKGYNVDQRGGPCLPKEDVIGYQALTQRDVFVVPKGGEASLFEEARQAAFTVHGFRYAEVCCTKEPPTNAYAIQYRTNYPTWGHFDSSNVVFNGAYELTRNAIESNTVSVQSDCPHRERLQYGGDLISSSPAVMHMFDMSGMYRKVVNDWIDSQFSNGAYTVTAFFMDLLDYTSVAGRGSGETIWASAPPVVTARHMRHYGDTRMAMDTLYNHAKWIDFLTKYWDEGIKKHYGDLTNYHGTSAHGLGDWYSLTGIDTYFSHHAFYLASVRSVAYLAKKLLDSTSHLQTDRFANQAYDTLLSQSLVLAEKIEKTMTDMYKGDTFTTGGYGRAQLGQDLGLFSRIMDGSKRCSVLKSWLGAVGNDHFTTWPGDEEQLFHRLLRKSDYDEMMKNNFLQKMGGGKTFSRYKYRDAVNSGIFGIKYTLKSLSENGFHTLALTKAAGPCPYCYPGYGMMMSFDATTLWETWWRSEDIYSRNHPMFGAIAEWLPEMVAGVSLSPTTTGGTNVLFFPQIPSTIKAAEIVNFASATQGTKRGDASIAWKLLPSNAAGTHKVVVRIVVPPGSAAELRLPTMTSQSGQWTLQRSTNFPNLETAKATAHEECQQRRANKEGYPHTWDYDSSKKEYKLIEEKKAIGTPCESFLFKISDPSWKAYKSFESGNGYVSVELQPGLFEATIEPWTLEQDIAQHGYETNNRNNVKGVDLGPFCSDPTTFDWDVNDAEHIA